MDEAHGFSDERISSATAEGLAMLRFSAEMALKNRIIMSVLREGEPFDEDRAREFAGEEIRALAEEQRDNERITDEARRKVSKKRERPPRHEADYQRGDAPALEARGEIYDSIADALDDLAGDDDYVDALVDRARRDAWHEIGGAITDRLEQEIRPTDRGYELNREQRIRYLKEVDLRRLERERRRAARARR